MTVTIDTGHRDPETVETDRADRQQTRADALSPVSSARYRDVGDDAEPGPCGSVDVLVAARRSASERGESPVGVSSWATRRAM